MKLQPAVKKETTNIAIGTAIGGGLIVLVFLIFHMIFPETSPFDYKVVLGAVIGCVVAVANFFFMAVTVQQVVDLEDQDEAKKKMKVSLRYRTLMQMGWVILAIVLPFINWIAGIAPLFIPSFVIKIRGTFGTGNKKS